jgi:hypothetical protein
VAEDLLHSRYVQVIDAFFPLIFKKAIATVVHARPSTKRRIVYDALCKSLLKRLFPLISVIDRI